MTRRGNRTVGFIVGTPSVGNPARRAAVATVDGRPSEVMAPEYRTVTERRLAQARRGEFGTDAEVEAVFRRFDP